MENDENWLWFMREVKCCLNIKSRLEFEVVDSSTKYKRSVANVAS